MWRLPAQLIFFHAAAAFCGVVAISYGLFGDTAIAAEYTLLRVLLTKKPSTDEQIVDICTAVNMIRTA